MQRDRTFLSCFALSLFLHLTMVTLFSIELRYEQKPIRYYPFDIVDVRRIEPAPPMQSSKFDLSADVTLPVVGDGSEYLASLPKISLPTLDLDEFPALNLPVPRYEDARQSGNPLRLQDAWARFGEEIQGVRNALRNVPPFDLLPVPESPQQPAAPVETAAVESLRPAPGVRGHIEWMAEPHDRKLLYSPPPPPQWHDAQSRLARSLAVMFQVNPDGSVGQVIAPLEDHGEVVDGIVDALKRYRFEPQPGVGSQPGSLVLEPEEAAP
jgi:hypothetical protein